MNLGVYYIFAYFALLYVYEYECKSDEDLITNLPWLKFQPKFKQFSGYLNADNVSYLHYWFIESENKPKDDPLLLWLNGGPGCSSLLGLFTENGPFRVSHQHSTVYENGYSWNKFANVLYMESPSGVGFSYNVINKTRFNDDETSLLNYNALKAFYVKFPEYQNHQLFISGESYGGIYLPTLSMHLLKDPQIKPQFKGVAIGNGYLNLKYMTNSYLPLIYNHVLLGERKWNKFIQKCCDGNAMGCDYFGISQKSPETDICCKLMTDLDNSVDVYGLDPYNLYDTCYLDPSLKNRWRTVYYYSMKKRMNLYKKKVDRPRHSNADYPDCYYDSDVLYLQRADVRKAIHIPDFVQSWEECFNAIKYDMQYTDMSPQLEELWLSKVRLLSYNGDLDTVCNAIGNKQFIDNLSFLKEGGNTSIWTYAEDKVKIAGLQTIYHGVDVVSVRGAGHMVPGDKPREAQQLIFNFLRKRPYSTPVDI